MGKTIAVFAGNRCHTEKEAYYYDVAYRMGKLLAQSGFVTVTGGGPGLMDETLHGASDHGGETIAIRLKKPGFLHSPFASRHEAYEKLGPRQDQILALSDAFIALPGGVGTLYEIMAVLALKRVGEIPRDKPLILVGEYYRDMQELAGKMVGEGFVDATIHDIFSLVATPEEAIQVLKNEFHI
jgi:uncharacterized protein (TIGR00730 family)